MHIIVVLLVQLVLFPSNECVFLVTHLTLCINRTFGHLDIICASLSTCTTLQLTWLINNAY